MVQIAICFDSWQHTFPLYIHVGQPASTSENRESVPTSIRESQHPVTPQNVSPKERTITLEELVSAVGVPSGKLDQKFLDRHLYTLSLSLKSWRSIAPHLGLEKLEIEDIESKGKNEEEKKQMTLQRWKKRRTFDATNRKLIEAHLKVGDVDSAKSVCHLLADDEAEGIQSCRTHSLKVHHA